jgi:hypothetical protein
MAFVTYSIADMTGGKWVNEKVEKFGGIGRVFLLLCADFQKSKIKRICLLMLMGGPAGVRTHSSLGQYAVCCKSENGIIEIDCCILGYIKSMILYFS